MQVSRTTLIAAAALLLAAPAQAAQFVYPLRGQSPATQDGDVADCAQIASQKSGFSPGPRETYLPPATAAGDASGTRTDLGAIGGGQQGGPAGALGGGGPGQAGAATDALVSDAGGAAAAENGVGGGSAQSGSRAAYNAARAACLTQRGYSVH